MSAYESRAWIKHYSDWTPATLDYGDKTIVDYYVNNLRINANKSATYFFGSTQSYADLDAQVRAAAAGLKAFGIRPGDRVAIVMPNCPQHVVAFYAVQLLGPPRWSTTPSTPPTSSRGFSRTTVRAWPSRGIRRLRR